MVIIPACAFLPTKIKPLAVVDCPVIVTPLSTSKSPALPIKTLIGIEAVGPKLLPTTTVPLFNVPLARSLRFQPLIIEPLG